MILIPIRTRGSNAREHWQARHRRVKGERLHTATALLGQQRPAIPCVVTLTRLSSGTLDEGDNLPAALKGVRDQIAAWLASDPYALATIMRLGALRIVGGVVDAVDHRRLAGTGRGRQREVGIAALRGQHLQLIVHATTVAGDWM